MALFLTIQITLSQYTKLDIVKFNVTRRQLLVIVNKITYQLTWNVLRHFFTNILLVLTRPSPAINTETSYSDTLGSSSSYISILLSDNAVLACKWQCECSQGDWCGDHTLQYNTRNNVGIQQAVMLTVASILIPANQIYPTGKIFPLEFQFCYLTNACSLSRSKNFDGIVPSIFYYIQDLWFWIKISKV